MEELGWDISGKGYIYLWNSSSFEICSNGDNSKDNNVVCFMLSKQWKQEMIGSSEPATNLNHEMKARRHLCKLLKS